MAELVGYKCPNCGGNVVFSAATQNMVCESCSSSFTEDELKQYEEAFRSAEAESNYNWQQAGDGTELKDMNKYTCQSCGAEIITDATTAASACPYCDSPIIMKAQLSGENQPDCIIPFKIDKNAAAKYLEQACKKKILLPKGFLSEKKIAEIKGVYVPFWMFDSNVSARLVYEGTKVHTWSTAKYIYTKTSYFDIFRAGTIDFANIPVDASSKMDDAYMDSIEPYNYAELSEFSPNYLSGFLADKYDVTVEQCKPRAVQRIENSTQDSFRSTVTGFQSVKLKSASINADNGSYKYALLPVWMLTTKFRGKTYISAVNGQTGKVAGELPVDKRKFWLLTAGITAGIFAAAQLLIFGGMLL